MAVSFSGSNYASVHQVGTYISGPALTFVARFKTTATTSRGALLTTFVRVGSTRGFYICTTEDGKVAGGSRMGSTTVYEAVSAGTYTPGVWQFVALRCPGWSDRNIWLNDGDVGTHTGFGPSEWTDSISSGAFPLGDYSSMIQDWFFTGEVAELGWYQGVLLSDAELGALNDGECPKNIQRSYLAAYYSCGGLYGRNTFDRWKNHYDLTGKNTGYDWTPIALTYTDHPRVFYGGLPLLGQGVSAEEESSSSLSSSQSSPSSGSSLSSLSSSSSLSSWSSLSSQSHSGSSASSSLSSLSSSSQSSLSSLLVAGLYPGDSAWTATGVGCATWTPIGIGCAIFTAKQRDH